MQSQARTVAEYLKELPPERRQAIEAVRKVIRKHLPRGYAEGMQYGMIGYFVPHKLYPAGHHCDPSQPLPFASLASQKNYMSLYMFCLYGDGEQLDWFRAAWAAAGKKLDMGKSCVRFKKLDDLALNVIGEAIRRVPVDEHIRIYEAATGGRRTGGSKRKSSGKKSAV